MNPIADLAKRVAALEANQNNSIQAAIVTNVRESDNLVDVEVRGVPLDKVPYLTWRAGGDGKSYWTPEVDESGILLCAGGQAGNAYFLPGLNTVRNPAPESNSDIIKLDFGDGREITIDNSETEIKRTGGTITIKAGLTELEVSATQIKGSIAGLGKILVNAAIVNVNGATFAAGATNMLNTAGNVIYAPVPIL